MSDLSVIMRKSRVFYDRAGECWLILHVPGDTDTDVGEFCCTMWQAYCEYLERAHADFSNSDAHRAGEPAGRLYDTVPAISR